MSTELISLEEIYTKLKIKGYLKNITENSENKFSATAIKTPKKISYLIEDEKYILKFISSNKLILIRENKDIISTMYFEINKTKNSIYTLKEKNITIDIKITTNVIEITDTSIKINYLVNDSENKFEYYIGWSD